MEGGGGDDARQREAGRRVEGQQGRQARSAEFRGGRVAMGKHLAAVDDAPMRVRVADIETEDRHAGCSDA